MTEQNEWTLQIDGMTCDHFAQSSDEALRSLPGVVQSTTRFSERRARVVVEGAIDGSRLAGAISAKGYKVVAQKSSAFRGKHSIDHTGGCSCC